MAAPALLIAIPILIGVVAGSLLVTPIGGALLVLALAWVAAAIGLWSRRGALVAAAAVGACFSSGLALGGVATRAAFNPSLLTWFHESPSHADPVTLTAVLREDAAAGRTGTSFTAEATAVSGHAVRGGVRVTIAGSLAGSRRPEWRGGRTVTMTVTLREPLDYRDPGVPSDRDRLARQGTVLLGSVKSAALVSLVARGSWIAEAAAALRARVRSGTAAAVAPWSPRSAAVVTAILIGDRSALDGEDERRLQEAGTYHVIAISGGNIALLTALLVLFGRMLRLPGRGTAAASIALLAFYGYAAGLAPSVLRATLAGMVYLAARALDHRGPALNALAVAGACAAAAAPLSVLDPGFVLSFGATVAIVTVASRVAPAFPRERGAERARVLGRQILAAAASLTTATICAEIALAPIGARLFGRVSLAGLVLNFLAIPLMSVIQVAGTIAVVLAPLWPWAALGCGWLAHAGTAALMRSASLVDVAPWLVLDIPPLPLWLLGLWYAGWTALLLARRRTVRLTSIALIVVTAAVIVRAPSAIAPRRVEPPPAGWTRVVFLDVGQGDATLVWPSGARPVLVDAGGVPGASFDLGRRVTVPALWAFGVRRLGTLVLTHGDPDHIGGAPAILRAFSPADVWDGVPVPGHEALQQLRTAAAAAGVGWTERHAGDLLIAGAATFRVLNPPIPDWERHSVRNDDSIVLELRVGDVTFILPGDITRAVEPGVIAQLTAAGTVVVKAPHHGSAGSSSPAFVEATHPAAVIFSAGRRNPFGHPAAAVVERYRAAGATVFSTADDGAVIVDTDGQQVRVWTWTGKDVLIRAPSQSRVHGPTAGHKEH